MVGNEPVLIQYKDFKKVPFWHDSLQFADHWCGTPTQENVKQFYVTEVLALVLKAVDAEVQIYTVQDENRYLLQIG